MSTCTFRDRQTDRQTETERETETHRETETERDRKKKLRCLKAIEAWSLSHSAGMLSSDEQNEQ